MSSSLQNARSIELLALKASLLDLILSFFDVTKRLKGANSRMGEENNN